jgi:predicted PurR-regulated permease PerM
MPDDFDQKERLDRRRRVLRTVLITLGITGILVTGLYLLRSFATTLLLIFAGILFGVFLDGAADLVRTALRLPRWAALTLVVTILVGSVAAFGWLEGPRVAHQVQQLGEQLPQSARLLQSQLRQTDWGRVVLKSLPSPDDAQFSFIALLGPVSQVFSVTFEILGSIVLIFFLGLYLAATPHFYRQGVLILLTPEHRRRGREVVVALRTALRWWLLGRAVTMTLMGTLTTLALWFMDVPLALVLGIIAAILLFVPYLGAVAAAVPACLIALMQSPMKAFWVAVIYTGVHVLEGYTITPYVQKRAVALPPAMLLSVQLLSAALFGTLGIVFSTPLLVVVIVLIQTLYLQDVLGEHVALLGEHEHHETP